MTAKVHDIAIVKLNGVDHLTKQGATLEKGGFQKTSQYASGRRTGSSREPIASKITVTFEHTTDADMDAVGNFEGNAEYVTSTGQTYTAPNAECMSPPSLRDNGSGFEVTIEGDEATKTAG